MTAFSNRTARTIAALAIALAATSVAFAGGKPDHPGNSDNAGGGNSHSQANEVHGNSAGDKSTDVAALAGPGNAAHASVQGLLHASPDSQVGRLRIYADLEAGLASGELQSAVDTAQAAFDLAYPDFDTLSPEGQAAALASDLGLALTTAEGDLATATADRDAALAAATKNADDPAVKAYIDGLLADYYAYAAAL